MGRRSETIECVLDTPLGVHRQIQYTCDVSDPTCGWLLSQPPSIMSEGAGQEEGGERVAGGASIVHLAPWKQSRAFVAKEKGVEDLLETSPHDVFFYKYRAISERCVLSLLEARVDSNDLRAIVFLCLCSTWINPRVASLELPKRVAKWPPAAVRQRKRQRQHLADAVQDSKQSTQPPSTEVVEDMAPISSEKGDGDGAGDGHGGPTSTSNSTSTSTSTSAAGKEREADAPSRWEAEQAAMAPPLAGALAKIGKARHELLQLLQLFGAITAGRELAGGKTLTATAPVIKVGNLPRMQQFPARQARLLHQAFHRKSLELKASSSTLADGACGCAPRVCWCVYAL